MRTRSRVFLIAALAGAPLLAQTEPGYLKDSLNEPILPADVAVHQLREYILQHVGDLPAPASAAQWTGQAARTRAQILNDVVYHGWPRAWVDAPPKFEETGVIEGNGYRIRKLRYEIVPGFQSAALLYEPLRLAGKVPAILNVNGHVGPPGKSVEYKQKRCITFARNGILALNLEWLSYGELGNRFNQHWYGAQLDLVGANELGLFYLAMRRGLDYLYNHPHTDRERLGVTGLSGGGWQTIVLSALDERVKVAVPVAGFSSIVPRVEARRYGDIGDLEQSATDLFDGRDYPWLAALRAPRPSLLVYNAEDDCCFRAAMVKPGVYDAVQPFFALYGRTDDLAWHENRDPGTHNYQLDNRRAAYAFFSRQFKLPPIQEDPGIGAEIRSYDDLVVGLPDDNLTIVGLARQLAGEIRRPALDRDAERAQLKTIVRYRPVRLGRLWTTAVTKHLGVETRAHLFAMSDGLAAQGVWLKAIGAPAAVPATIVLDDKGRGATAEAVAARVNRGEQVLAVDLPFQGDSWRGAWSFEQMISTIGDRPLGIEAAHLIEIAHWLKRQGGAPAVRVETSGMRNQVVALAAAALDPSVFSAVQVRQGISSLHVLLDQPVSYSDAADLFCLDLYRVTDLDRLAALAAPAEVTTVR